MTILLERLSIRSLRAALALLLTVGGLSTAIAQTETDQAEARTNLSGPNVRVWIKQRVEVSMGGDKRCTAGETYTFRANNTVDLSKCTNHVLVKRNVPWTLLPHPPLDVDLRFDGRLVQLSFGGTARSPQMRWRKPGQVKPDPTTDIYLGLSKD